MLNTHYIARLAAAGRARVMHVDYPSDRVAVRLLAPVGGAPGWPKNVVALRFVPYRDAAHMRGLVM